jgi:RNA polymerase sigma-70 factor (ECF subfamily)
MEKLCRDYRAPLLDFFRRRWSSPSEAEDLAQGFFEHLVERQTLRRVDPGKGRFRTFLLAAAEYFLIDQWRKRRGAECVPLEDAGEPAPHPFTADEHFDREWARQTVAQVMRRLEREYEAGGRRAVFQTLRARLTAPGESAADAAALGLSEGAARVALHRLRRRFGELLRAQIAETVATPEELQEEIRYLIAVLGRAGADVPDNDSRPTGSL